MFVGSRLAHARRSDNYDRKPLEPPSEIEEKPQRGSIAPMDIINGDENRGLRRQIDHQPVQTVKRFEEMAVSARQRGLAIRLECEHWSSEGGGACQQLACSGVVSERGREQLADHAIRELALKLATRAGQHPIAVGSSERLRSSEKGRFSDPGRALNEDPASVSAARSRQSLADDGKLAVSLQQCDRSHCAQIVEQVHGDDQREFSDGRGTGGQWSLSRTHYRSCRAELRYAPPRRLDDGAQHHARLRYAAKLVHPAVFETKIRSRGEVPHDA